MKKITNIVCVILGSLFLVIGFLGILLPILPTTPFFLLAAFFYARGFEKFHIWFTGTTLYEKYIVTALQKKEMDKSSKRKAICILGLIFCIGFYFTPIWFAKIIILIVGLGHIYYFAVKIKTVENASARLNNEFFCGENILYMVEWF